MTAENMKVWCFRGKANDYILKKNKLEFFETAIRQKSMNE